MEGNQSEIGTPMSSVHVPSEKLPRASRTMGVVFLLIIAVLMAGVLLARWHFASVRTPPEQLFGEIPYGVEVVNSFMTAEGAFARFYLPEAKVGVSVVRSAQAPQGDAAVQLEEWIEGVRRFRATEEVPEGFDTLFVKYASAHFDARRAVRLAPATFEVKGRSVPTLQFITKPEDNYLLAIIPGEAHDALVLAYRRDEPVDSGAVEAFVNSLPYLTQIPPASAATAD